VNPGRQGEILLTERSLAIVVAAKSQTMPYGQEIRVVYVPTGEVVYSKNSYTSQTTVLECA
jgi:curli biogenesis system outer membrane secretion channel CsgG